MSAVCFTRCKLLARETHTISLFVNRAKLVIRAKKARKIDKPGFFIFLLLPCSIKMDAHHPFTLMYHIREEGVLGGGFSFLSP